MTKYEKRKVLLCMLMVYLVNAIGIKGIPLHTSTDELGTVVGAAWLAGLNWSGVISNSGYYGFGWYSLFFWIFKLTDNPSTIYCFIVFGSIFLRAFIVPIVFYIGKNYLHIEKERELYLLSFLMPFLTSQSVGIIANEFMLELLFWLIVLFTCKIIQNQDNKKRYIYYIVLILLCAYGFLIHTRALVMIISASIVLVINGIIRKKVSILGVVCCIAGTYVVAKKILLFYQMQIYGMTGQSLRNGSVVYSKVVNFFDKKTWEIWAHMLLGMVDTEIILTAGVFLIALIALPFYIYTFFKNKAQINVFCIYILALSILAMGGTVVAFLFSNWFEGMYNIWGAKTTENNYAYKALTYVRYWNIYVPPFILCLFSYLEKVDYKKILNYATGILCGLHVCYLQYILPLIQCHNDALTPFYGLSGFNFGKDIANYELYLKCILISMAFGNLIYIILQTKRRQVALSLIIIFTVVSQKCYTFGFDNPVKERMASKILASYEEKCKLEKTGQNIGQIYLYDTEDGDKNWKIYSIAQFYFNRYTLLMGLPDDMKANDIIISPVMIEGIDNIYKDIFCYKIDDNEVWYTYMQLN